MYVSACSTYILIPLSYLFSAQCHLLSFLLIHSGYHVFFIPPYLYFDISFISILPPFPIISYNSWWFSWYILSIYILRSPSIFEVNFWRLERYLDLSSPRAESARAFTGRRNSHSGRGEDFLSRQPIFFTETAVTPERKVEKSFPRWEINRHAEG